MNSLQIFLNIGIIITAGFITGLIFKKFKQSLIVAYLISGIIIGPMAWA